MSKLNTSILFVDDDKFTRTTFSITLKKITEKLYIAKNGKEGISVFRKHQPDIVISDIQMPDMNGLEMIRKIKEINSEVKTIITTAYNEVNYFIEAIDIGVNGYLLKPIDNKKLLSLIEELSKPADISLKSEEEVQKKKRAEETLRESEKLYKALLKQTEDMIFIYAGNKVLFVNEKISQMTGFSEHEIYRGEIWDLIHPNDRARMKSLIKRRTKGTQPLNKIETTIVTKSGEMKFVDVALTMIDYRGKKAVMGTARDITDRKKAESALIKSQERLKFALDATNDGLWDWNCITNEVYFSPRYAAMLGYEPNELKGVYSTWESLLHPDDKRKTLKIMRDYLKNKRGDINVEFRLKTKEGKWKWVLGRGKVVEIDELGKPVRLVGTHVDLEERKIAERKIQESEKKYKALFERAGDAIFIHNLKGRFLEVNRIACERIGYNKEELLTMSLKDVEIFDQTKSRQDLLEIIIARQEYFYQTIHRTKEGREIHVEINSKLIDYKGKKAVLSIVRDISQRVQAQKNLLKSLKEKEILLQEVHHRVKNNMQLISSILNLQSKTVKNPVVRGYLEESQERIRSMAIIHENLYKSKNLVHVDFEDYVKTLSDNLLRSYVEDRNKIQIGIKIKDINLSLDVGIPCGLIINELVSNAFKYAFEDRQHGKIDIEIHQLNKRKLKLIVKDNGIGIKNTDIKSMETLGLQLVATLVEQINGKIEISNQHGTEINIIFKV